MRLNTTHKTLCNANSLELWGLQRTALCTCLGIISSVIVPSLGILGLIKSKMPPLILYEPCSMKT